MSGKAILKEIGSTLLYIVVVLGITWLVITFVGQRTEVNGSSMEPTLSNNDNLIVDKISYRFKDPQRFDIIVFPFQYDENVYYIKRIIGLPGETVQIGTDGTIYIDGQVLEEGYGKEVMLSPGRAGEPILVKTTKSGDQVSYPFTVPEGEYFVLGDNRNNSSDSREPSVGNIHRDQIIGKAWVRIWPFHKFGVLKHQ